MARARARNLVLELSPYNITINAIAPGAIVNERNLSDDPDYETKWASVVPMRRAVEELLTDRMLYAVAGAGGGTVIAAALPGRRVLLSSRATRSAEGQSPCTT